MGSFVGEGFFDFFPLSDLSVPFQYFAAWKKKLEKENQSSLGKGKVEIQRKMKLKKAEKENQSSLGKGKVEIQGKKRERKHYFGQTKKKEQKRERERERK